MKHYLYMRLFLFVFLSIPVITISHGFDGATCVWRSDGSVCSLAQLVQESSRNQRPSQHQEHHICCISNQLFYLLLSTRMDLYQTLEISPARGRGKKLGIRYEM